MTQNRVSCCFNLLTSNAVILNYRCGDGSSLFFKKEKSCSHQMAFDFVGTIQLKNSKIGILVCITNPIHHLYEL